MSATMNILFLICAIALVLIGIVYPVFALQHFRSIDEGIQKVAILLTVLANKQGATDEDIALATGTSEQPANAPASAPESASAKNGGNTKKQEKKGK